jgi:ubiquinone/menaquinone biosynthesis C-methylase UbiE
MEIRDPTRVSPRWEDARTVAGLSAGTPNLQLLEFARSVLARRPGARCLDIGCGAARNALPLAEMGFRVTATDLSQPMLDAARTRVANSPVAGRIELLLAPMAPLPFDDASFDLVVAHGIWNLARTDGQFRAAVAEAARVAAPGAGLFLFTFSRSTFPPDAAPDAGESFVFSGFNGEPQCFLTEAQIAGELAAAGFVRDRTGPMAEYNVPPRMAARAAPSGLATAPSPRGGPPAIWEATFVRGDGPGGRP